MRKPADTPCRCRSDHPGRLSRPHKINLSRKVRLAAGNGLDDQIVAAAEIGIGATIIGPQYVRAGAWPVAGSQVTGVRTMDGVVGGRTASPSSGIRADPSSVAAGGQDVRLGGGVATIQQFLRAGLIDATEG